MTELILRMRPPKLATAFAERKDPYILRGRNREIKEISSRLLDLPQATSLIMGPPGSGKTSLMNAIKGYARWLGFAVATLHIADIAVKSPAEIATTIVNNVNNRTPKPKQNLSERNRRFGVNANYDDVGLGIDYSDAWRAAQRKECVDSLNRAMQDRTIRQSRGLIVCIDEIQNIAKEIPNPDDWQRLSPLLTYLHEGNLTDQGYKLLPLYAGLDTSDKILHRVGITRLEGSSLLRLGALGETAGAQVLRDHLRVQDDADNSPVEVPEHVIKRLAQDFHRCAHHIGACGYELQRVAMEARDAGLDRLPTMATNTIASCTQQHCERLYQQRITNIQTNTQLDRYVAPLAQAFHACDNRISTQGTQNLVAAIRSSQGEDTTFVNVKATIEQLKRQGIIREMLMADVHLAHCANRQADRNHYCVAISSMTTWLESERKREHRDYRELISDTVQHEQKHPVLAWKWDYDGNLPQLDPLPPRPAGKYRNQSDKTGLLLPLPGDVD